MNTELYNSPEFMDHFRGGAEWAFRVFYDDTISDATRWLEHHYPYYPSDVKQDCIAKAYYTMFKNRVFYKCWDQLRGTFFNIVKNEMIDVFRKRRSRNNHEKEYKWVQEFVELPPDEKTDYIGMVKWAISRLSGRQKEVLVLLFYSEKTVSEVADITGLSPQTVRNFKTRGLDQIRKKLRPKIRQLEMQ